MRLDLDNHRDLGSDLQSGCGISMTVLISNMFELFLASAVVRGDGTGGAFKAESYKIVQT